VSRYVVQTLLALWAGCWYTVEPEKITNCFYQCTIELIVEVEIEQRSCRHEGRVALETWTSSEVETRLSFIGEMQTSKCRRSSHFVEVTQSLRWRCGLLFVEGTRLCYFAKARVSFKVKTHLSLDVETRLWALQIRTWFKVETQFSLGTEAQLSYFVKMRVREYWRGAVFEVETRLSLCWVSRLWSGDADFSLLKRYGSVKRKTRVLGMLPRVWRSWRDVVLFKREMHVLGTLPRVWWRSI